MPRCSRSGPWTCSSSDPCPPREPLRYVCGSHRLGPVGKADLFRTDLDLASAGLAPPEGFVWTEVAAEVPAGGIAMHHRDTLHASGPNLSLRSRISLAIRVRTDRCELVGNAAQVAIWTTGNLHPWCTTSVPSPTSRRLRSHPNCATALAKHAAGVP